jgi:hypothetical protein
MARFSPAAGSTISITSGVTAVNAAIDANAPLVGIVGVGNNMVFVRFSRSDNPIAATTSDFPIYGGGSQVVLAKPHGYDVVSCISPVGGTDTVYICTGTDVL